MSFSESGFFYAMGIRQAPQTASRSGSELNSVAAQATASLSREEPDMATTRRIEHSWWKVVHAGSTERVPDTPVSRR